MTKEEIIREIELSRLAVARDITGMRAELDFVAKARRAIAARPLLWLGGAASLGFFLSGRFWKRRRPAGTAGQVTTRARRVITFWGLVIALLRFLLPILRPVVSAYVAKRIVQLTDKAGKK